MLWITDKTTEKYMYHGMQKGGYQWLLDRQKRFYRSSDTNMSYRQMNSLGDSDMLPVEAQKSESGWRKFSFKDLVYLEILNVCRKFGLNNDQLQMLKSDFYDKEEEKDLFNHGDRILLLTYIGEKITLMITKEGKAIFADMYYHAFLDTRIPYYLQFNVNEIVKWMWKDRLRIKEDDAFPKYLNWSQVLDNNQPSKKPTSKEAELLEIIRNGDYKVITIEKQGKNFVIKAGEEINDTNANEFKLVEMLKSRDFANITIQKRGGQVVGYHLEDFYKV